MQCCCVTITGVWVPGVVPQVAYGVNSREESQPVGYIYYVLKKVSWKNIKRKLEVTGFGTTIPVMESREYRKSWGPAVTVLVCFRLFLTVLACFRLFLAVSAFALYSL